MTEYLIDCSGCERRGPDGSECDECVVAFILDRPEGAIIFNAAEERAIRSLSGGGLLPEARFKRRTG